MFNWFNMKKKSLPQQVLENTNNIEKLFDNALADITQLNFKQDEEESLVYENGVAKFKGKTTIIRDENAENVLVSSEMEFKVSSGDDDVVIDAGEDNSTLEIHLDNETRNKINRALLTPLSTPSEREFVAVGINNSQIMIPESEINDNIEKRELLYVHDGDDVIDISDSELTSLQDYCKLFNNDMNKIYKCYKNPDNNPNFYNLVGDVGAGSYKFIYVRLYSKGITDSSITWSPYRVYEVFVMSSQQVIARKYLTANNNSVFEQSAWVNM